MKYDPVESSGKTITEVNRALVYADKCKKVVEDFDVTNRRFFKVDKYRVLRRRRRVLRRLAEVRLELEDMLRMAEDAKP